MATMISTSKPRYTVKYAPSMSSKQTYSLRIDASGMAVDCNCPDRINRGRKAGRACKHMMSHNTAYNEARKAEKEAARVATQAANKARHEAELRQLRQARADDYAKAEREAAAMQITSSERRMIAFGFMR